MLEFDFREFQEGLDDLEKSKNEHVILIDQLREEAYKLRQMECKSLTEELDLICAKIEKAQSLQHTLRLLINAAGLSLYRYQLAEKMSAYKCESIFISPVKGRRMRKIALTHLKNEMSDIRFGKELY